MIFANTIYLFLNFEFGFSMYTIFFLLCTAWAQESTSSRESGDEQAKAFYKTATVFFEEADYEQAIHFFKMAYERSKRTPILYNIAVAYEKIGDYEQAVSYYEEYKFSAPEEEVLVLERKIENLKKLAQKKQEEQQDIVDNVVEKEVSQVRDVSTQKSSNIQKYTPVMTTTALALAASFFTIRYTTQKSSIEENCNVEGICKSSAKDLLEKERTSALWADISWGLTGVGMLYTVIHSKKNSNEKKKIDATQ